eukprot:scaffold10241_cov127-Isochrysis_galbana.AAC.10
MLAVCVFAALSSTPTALRWPRLVSARPCVLQEALAVAGGGGSEVSGTGPLLALYGHVRGRRSLGRNLAFIDIEPLDDVDEEPFRPIGGASGDAAAAPSEPCPAVQAILRSSNGPGAAPRTELLSPGARIALLGRARLSPRGSLLLVVLESRLLTAAPSSHGVRAALAAVREGAMTVDEGVRALTPASGSSPGDGLAWLTLSGKDHGEARSDQGQGEASPGETGTDQVDGGASQGEGGAEQREGGADQTFRASRASLAAALSRLASAAPGAEDAIDIDSLVVALRLSAPRLAVASACGAPPALPSAAEMPEAAALGEAIAAVRRAAGSAGTEHPGLCGGRVGWSVARALER